MKYAVRFAAILTVATSLGIASTTPPEHPAYWGFTYTIKKASADGSSWLQVIHVTPGSPADKAGMLAGDMIVTINEKPLQFRDHLDVILMLAAIPIQKPSTLTLIRTREQLSITMVPTQMAAPQYERWKSNVARLMALRTQARRP